MKTISLATYLDILYALVSEKGLQFEAASLQRQGWEQAIEEIPPAKVGIDTLNAIAKDRKGYAAIKILHWENSLWVSDDPKKQAVYWQGYLSAWEEIAAWLEEVS